MNSNVRVRFAPSPTGALHIGGLRTALYNYLYAKQKDGVFILRIEDTDQSRLVPGAEAYIVEALEWLGIAPDESSQRGGPHTPYRQSERAAIYQQYAQQLLDEGKAYYAFDTAEELDAMRQRLKEAKVANQQYNSVTRVSMRNSLSLPESEVKKLIAEGVPYVVRIKIPPKEEIRFEDLIRGWVKVHGSTLDDKVILKSGGLPTYHLANVVDDHLMGISHVIRGEEWLPSAPLHVLLYRYLGWSEEMPAFAHLPLILKPDGNGKLSKRDADRLGFPIFPLNWSDPKSGETSEGFRERGYLPEAMLNFLALLGWNPGNDSELFSVNELVASFSLERIVKSGAKFDIAKAQWFNQQYLRQKSPEELQAVIEEHLAGAGIPINDQKISGAINLVKDRISFSEDLWNESKFLFLPPSEYDMAVIQKKWDQETALFLENYSEKFSSLESYSKETLHDLLKEQLEKAAWGFGKVMPALRIALTGVAKGPDLMETMEILGQSETQSRIAVAIKKFNSI